MKDLTYNEKIKLATLVLLEIEKLVDEAIAKLKTFK